MTKAILLHTPLHYTVIKKKRKKEEEDIQPITDQSGSP